jgi:hypothetical protein
MKLNETNWRVSREYDQRQRPSRRADNQSKNNALQSC